MEIELKGEEEKLKKAQEET